MNRILGEHVEHGTRLPRLSRPLQRCERLFKPIRLSEPFGIRSVYEVGIHAWRMRWLLLRAAAKVRRSCRGMVRSCRGGSQSAAILPGHSISLLINIL